MTLDKSLVTVGGIGLIGLIYWFFFGKREDTVAVASEKVDILVDGGYKPSVIKVKKGQRITISLLRKDTNSCLEEFIFPDFKIKKLLPMNEKVEIKIAPEKKGTYPFHCGMSMFNGKVIVE